MQTKNINVDRGPLNNELEINLQLKNVNVEKSRAVNQETSHQRSNFPEAITDGLGNNGAPPLPPRTAIIFTPFSALSKLQAEVDGYGPYKPVPPPKPLPNAVLSRQEGITPPPYRMPPYPLYNEPITIPGAASFESPLATSSPANQSLGLQTHSNKFPIEREVILTSTDKNSKIPILHDYKKRTTAAIAPDAPPKQMAAWTQNQVQNHLILSPDQTHPNHVQTSHQPDNGLYRASYHGPSDYYNGQNPVSTGAVPRSTWHSGGDPNKPAPRPFSEDYPSPQTVSVQIESTKDGAKETNKNGKSMTKTYHTIKDMISSRFKGNKDCLDEKAEEAGLNNIADELRRSQRNLGDEQEIKKTAGEQGIYGKPRIDQASSSSTPSMYNQHMMQQHIIAQQAQQQFQINQQARAQQNAYVHQMAQARSQELLTQSRSEDLYYQSQYISAQQRSIVNTGNRFVVPQSREQSYVQIQQHSQLGNINNKDGLKDERRQPIPMERRSAQQIERENQRQKNLADFRRAASQPQLNQDEEIVVDVPGSKPQPQIPSNFIRRGSHGNLVEATLHVDPGKDSDDGGFLKRNNSKEMKLDHKQEGIAEFTNEEADFNQQSSNGKDDGKVTEALQGAPRKRLEGEIGKIEGVYNVGQRSKPEEDVRNAKKTPGSAASSDYDKTGGLSSSNVDSGRGSAAYSSGRRPNGLDIIGDTCDSAPLTSGSYRDLHTSGHDSEWVDIVENELRHILEPKLHELSLHGQPGRANSAISESISSMTPPLPPLSPGDQSSPNVTPRNSARYKHSSSLPYGSKPDYDAYIKSKNNLAREVNPRWHGSSSHKTRSSKKLDHALLRNKQMFGLDTTTDLTSTTTRSLDLESMLDGQSDSEGDLSTADARTIRKQLEGLETMYSEVLKLLGVKKHGGRYQPSDPRFSKRRYGSMSSLPSSSVSSRPIRDKRKAHEDRKKVRDIRGINKRFQRLESHVVTLARSVAHLSSEMRTQHLMIQEMENIRGEIAALRAQTNMLNVRSQNVSRAVNSSKDLPSLANPSRVKKLTKFFGDEPPLLRLFLRKLGYEKYASVFENEKIGMVELPYMSEERLQKMGVPLGPRLRIMQEAQISVCKENTLCIV